MKSSCRFSQLTLRPLGQRDTSRRWVLQQTQPVAERSLSLLEQFLLYQEQQAIEPRI